MGQFQKYNTNPNLGSIRIKEIFQVRKPNYFKCGTQSAILFPFYGKRGVRGVSQSHSTFLSGHKNKCCNLVRSRKT